VAGLGLAGCAATTFADLANLSDPRTVVDESVNGQSVTLRNGRVLVVHLPVTTGDGNRWELVPLAATPLGSPIRIDYMNADGLLQPIPPFSGAMQAFNRPGATQPSIVLDASKPAPLVTGGEAVLRLRGVAPGNATVQLDYRRVDAPGAPAAKSVRFDVTVL
jgi:predicted secreted protein